MLSLSWDIPEEGEGGSVCVARNSILPVAEMHG